MKYPPLLILPIALAVSQAWAETNPTPEETVTLPLSPSPAHNNKKPIALLSTPKLLCNPSLPATGQTFYNPCPT